MVIFPAFWSSFGTPVPSSFAFPFPFQFAFAFSLALSTAAVFSPSSTPRKTDRGLVHALLAGTTPLARAHPGTPGIGFWREQRFDCPRMSLPPSSWIVSSLDDTEDGGPPPTRSSATEPVPAHLFLHFDINETILLGDEAGGDSRHESTHKMLAKSAFCRIPEPEASRASGDTTKVDTKALTPTHWWDGQEIGGETSVPKLYTGFEWPPGCVPYYRTASKKHAKSFARDANDGAVYKPVLEACEAALARAPTIQTKPTRDADAEGTKGRNDTILPAFYETLCHLIGGPARAEAQTPCGSTGGSNTEGARDSQPPPPFTVVFRTFGSDLPEIAEKVTAFARGEHPDYPGIDAPSLCLPRDRLYQGRWKEVDTPDADTGDGPCEEGSPQKAVYQLWNYHDETELVASGDAEILELLGSGHGVFGIRDDYDFWKKHDYSPTAGKPVWVPEYPDTGRSTPGALYGHHLLFDDNIHGLPDDGIACVRRESGGSFETVSGAETAAYHGVHLVRVPTVEPVLNPRWYIEQIAGAGERLRDRMRGPL